ncbi:MAG: hypothetical protein RIQ93_2406 [Verrucomicrobiota bacterium]|jgi:proteasome accessory factor A
MISGGGPRLVPQIRDWIFERNRYGLLDRHERGWDEPPGNGGFLFNGGRFYVDMGHLEYCTAECATAADVVRYDRAGDRILLEAVAALGLGEHVSIFRNNIDHRSGATFGCHENYSLTRAAPLTEGNVLSLLTFLTLRVLFTGSGRVGGSSVIGQPASEVDFQISQRADYIETDLYEWVQHNRAIINTRDEPLADPRHFRRLHLLHGDTNVLPSALYLKVGSTRLVLDLLEIDDLPPLVLMDAVGALHALSHQPTPPWRVDLSNNRGADPVEVLSVFRERAQKRFAGRDADTDAVLAFWSRVEAGLAGDLESLVGSVDWITKHHILDRFRQAEGLQWNDPWMEAQDLEFHHIDPARSLGLALARNDGPWSPANDGTHAQHRPPPGTRATLRSELMQKVAAKGLPYQIDWHRVEMENGESVLMMDPLETRLRH